MRAFERKCPMRNQSRREAPLKRLQEERQKSGKEGQAMPPGSTGALFIQRIRPTAEAKASEPEQKSEVGISLWD